MKPTILSISLLVITSFSYINQAKSASLETDTVNHSEKTTTMTKQDFTTSITVEQTPTQVFNAINNVRGWWSEEVNGPTEKLNDVFDYHFQDVHICKMKLVEVIPNKKVVWLVEENYFNFTKDQTEWVGTKCIFNISEQDGKTKLVFTHQGLIPQHECYKICHDAWTNYIQVSLKDLITTGKGKPNGKEKPRTEDEKKLSKG